MFANCPSCPHEALLLWTPSCPLTKLKKPRMSSVMRTEDPPPCDATESFDLNSAEIVNISLSDFAKATCSCLTVFAFFDDRVSRAVSLVDSLFSIRSINWLRSSRVAAVLILEGWRLPDCLDMFELLFACLCWKAPDA